MEQQTAVQFLINYMLENFHLTDYTVMVVFEQAKQMEKEQIMKAVYDSMGTNFDPNMGRAEQYYNETYQNK